VSVWSHAASVRDPREASTGGGWLPE
jgi:hypothetical protein